MALTDLVPWGRNRSTAPQRFSEGSDPFLSLHREMNRMFDEFARGFGNGLPTSCFPSFWFAGDGMKGIGRGG
jgi:HSP20 family protein